MLFNLQMHFPYKCGSFKGETSRLSSHIRYISKTHFYNKDIINWTQISLAFVIKFSNCIGRVTGINITTFHKTLLLKSLLICKCCTRLLSLEAVCSGAVLCGDGEDKVSYITLNRKHLKQLWVTHWHTSSVFENSCRDKYSFYPGIWKCNRTLRNTWD